MLRENHPYLPPVESIPAVMTGRLVGTPKFVASKLSVPKPVKEPKPKATKAPKPKKFKLSVAKSKGGSGRPSFIYNR
jgi:hypothetical protein